MRDQTVMLELDRMVSSLRALLRDQGVEVDPARSPLIREMTTVWTQTIQGRSLLDALALLWVGTIALKGEWQDALAEQAEERSLLGYARFPAMEAN